MYDSLAPYYHLIFENWVASIARQAAILGPLIESACGAPKVRILDAACGIGTQAIGLAMRGHRLTCSDSSEEAIARARIEAAARGLDMSFCVADMRDLAPIPDGPFDAVVIADNAVAHLPTEDDMRQAAISALRQLRPGGVLIATVRDYDKPVQDRPTFQGPTFYNDNGRRRIIHQVWDWTGERHYIMHLYITRETEAGWESHYFAAEFHAISKAMLERAFGGSGFRDIEWHDPSASRYYQLVMVARASTAGPPDVAR